MDGHPSPELLDLIDAVCDGELTPERLARLESLLAGDVEAQQFYLRCMNAQSRLERFDAARSDVDATDVSAERSRGAAPLATRVYRYFSQLTPLSITTALLVMLSMLGVLSIIAVPNIEPREIANEEAAKLAPVARISAMHNVRWGQGGEAKQLHSELFEGERVELSRGRLEITFTSGAKIAVGGRATFRLEGDNALRLQLGQVAAHVPRAAHGFEVQTAAATFTDLGTQFVVSVGPGENSAVYVQQGRVAYRTSAETKAVVLLTGQGVEVLRDGIVHEAPLQPRALAFLRTAFQPEELLVNGDFEGYGGPIEQRIGGDGQPFGWRSASREGVIVRAADQETRPVSGARLAQFTGHPSGGAAIDQQFATETGKPYQLRLYLSRMGDGVVHPTIEIELSSGAQSLHAASESIDWAEGTWRVRTYRFVARAAQTTLRIQEPVSSPSASVAPLVDAVSITRVLEEPSDEPAAMRAADERSPAPDPRAPAAPP